MLSQKRAERFKRLLEGRIAELSVVITDAQKDTYTLSARNADPADQAAAEYERQAVVTKSVAAQQQVKVLKQALQRIQEGTFGECADCGGEIELKRLEALPAARYCVKCQTIRELS